MAYTTIDDPSAHFQTKIYAGTGSAQSLTNDGNSNLKPDWIWFKNRSTTSANSLIDSSRGASVRLRSDATDAESSASGNFVSFNTDGFSIDGSGSGYNTNSENFVAWQWKANGGTTTTNSDGNITSTVQANTTAGFSIVTFTGNGNNDATIGHGLGTTPAMIITKNRDDAVLWRVWHQNLTSTNVLFLNEDFAQTAPSGHSNGYIKTVGSSTYSVYQGNSDTNGVNGSSDNMIAYCFAEKQGYSKFGSYTGNASSSDGPFIYTGFKPAFFLIKSIGAARFWHILDNKRNTINPVNLYLNPNNSDADGTFVFGDFLSNGFKITNNGNTFNTNGETYIYMAFAEHPFVSSKGVPVTAR